MDQEAVDNRVRELIQPLLDSRQIQLVELTLRPAGGRVLVRCLVDTAKGITLDELGHLNQAIGAILEEHDVIPSAYLLEVNSPGLDRPLKTCSDFERVIGRRVKVSTTTVINDRREYVGELVGAGEEFITVKIDSGEKVRILLAQIAKAVQEIEL